MDVIGLLQSKKRCLRRVQDVTRDFLVRAAEGDFSGLEAFESRRDAAFRTLELIDRRLTETVQALAPESRDEALARSVQAALDEAQELVQTIFRLDGQVLTCFEREKLRLTQEIGTARKSHEMAGRFKSGWVPEAGEELDQKA